MEVAASLLHPIWANQRPASLSGLFRRPCPKPLTPEPEPRTSVCVPLQTYNTGDTSRNNWWVGILAFGEGWHNNHHAFEYSARHGFEWWQVDMTWYVIKALKAVGLASNVKLVSEKQKARLAFQ